MKAKGWLTYDIEETRRGGSSVYSLKLTGVRQTLPLDRLSTYIELEIPDDVVFPKAKLLVEHQEAVQLRLSEVPDAESR